MRFLTVEDAKILSNLDARLRESGFYISGYIEVDDNTKEYKVPVMSMSYSGPMPYMLGTEEAIVGFAIALNKATYAAKRGE